MVKAEPMCIQREKWSHMEQEVHVWVHAQRHTIALETFMKAPLFIYISIHPHTMKSNVPVEAPAVNQQGE